MNPTPDAEERQMDWLLSEVLGGTVPPDRRAAIAARVQSTISTTTGLNAARQRWLAAALIPFAAAVAFGVAWLRREPGQVPVQDPAPKIWVEAHGPDSLGKVDKDVRHLKCFDMTDEGLAGLAEFAALESLDLTGADVDSRGTSRVVPITGSGFEHLRKLTNLRWLAVTGHNFTGEGLQHLVGLPRLEHLDLTYTRVGEAGLAVLERFPSLRELSLAYCANFPGSALAAVGRCAGLQRLSLAGCWTIRAGDLAHLENLSALRHLDLSGCRGYFQGQTMGEPPFAGDDIGITDDDVEGLASLRLESLQLSDCPALTSRAFFTIAKMPTLRGLGIGGLPKVGGECLNAVPDTIERLDVSGNRHFQLRDLRAIASMRQLRELDLSGLTQLGDDDLAAILQPLRLRVLRLNGPEPRGKADDDAVPMALTSAAARIVATQQDLEELHLHRTAWLDATTLPHIAGLPRLRVLSLCWNRQLQDGDLASLADAKALESLDLMMCGRLTLKALEPLTKAPLRYLSTYYTKVPPAALAKFAQQHWPGCTIHAANAVSWTVPMPR